MYRAVRILVIIAVLWCGLHLSPAEADAPMDRDDRGAAAQAADAGDRADHAPRHAAQACHNHCPVAPDLAHGLAFSPPARVAPALFAASARELSSLSRAPPVQPPSA